MASWRRSKRKDEPPRRARRREPEHDDDLTTRLGPLAGGTSDRAPTADELRAAFGRKPREPEAPPQKVSEFESQYSTESLFAGADEPFLNDDYDPDDPWSVLGLGHDAEWEDVVMAHRRMAKAHHPDRLNDAPADIREASENRMREINIAYTTLRRLHGH